MRPETVRRGGARRAADADARALFGEDLAGLRDEVGPHVARTVRFFVAACRHGGVNWVQCLL